ncbi:MAG: TolC family protein [Elusimicrobia bacterium]|nr:TolC family protein [Elusimicrobiota bacterium]
MNTILIVFTGTLQAASLTLGTAAREALQKSPEIRAAAAQWQKSALEEPGLLALTDPVFGARYSQTDDRSARSAPAFQGAFSKSKDWEASLTQDLLIGTESRLFFRTQELQNPSLFRPIDPTHTSSLGVEIRQPLLRYFWGRPDKAKRRQARAGVKAAANALKQTREKEAAQAMLAYVEVFTAQEQISIREAALADARKLLDNYKEKRRYGLVESSDLLQAEVSVRAQETELRLAQSQLKQAEETLRRALYRRGEEPFEKLRLPEIPQRTPPAMEEAWATAEANRGDYLSAQHLVERAESFVRVEHLSTLPDLSVFGSYAWGGLDSRFSPSWSQVNKGDFPIYTTGVQLKIPLFWKKERIRRAETALNLESARAERDRTAADIRREIGDALENLRLSRDRASAYEELLTLEKEKFQAAQEDFNRGRANTDLLIRFQNDIRRTESLVINAKAQALAGWARLGFATGNLIEGFADLTGEAIEP